MKTPVEKSESLKKVLQGSQTFDEAVYYKSHQAEMGGENISTEDEPEDDDEVEEESYYGDED